MNFEILKENLKGNTLILEIEIPPRRYIKERKIIVTTQEIIETIREKYNIVEILEEAKIDNYNISNNIGTWIFRVRKAPKARAPKKKAPSPKEENPLTSNNIRGRMRNILEKCEET